MPSATDERSAEQIAAEGAAAVRAMPLPRLLSGGMDYAAAVELIRRAEAGEPWVAIAEELGEAAAVRARQAIARGHTASARAAALLASAAFRFGQNPLPDADPRKRSLYERLLLWYARAADLAEHPVERVRIPWRGRFLCGWLHLPVGAMPAPVTIQMGGFDGWREEYHLNALALLERGIGSLLLDGPGQGETRLFEGVYLSADVDRAFSAAVDFLRHDARCDGQVAIWGNSLGGYLAALSCCRDPRFVACVVNGGTIRPSELPERHPRFISKVQALLGDPDPVSAGMRLSSLELGSELASLRCPLHVVHGGADRVFLIESARALYQRAGSADRTFTEFPDGDHCIYNRSQERNCVIGDWLAERLLVGTGQAKSWEG